MTNGPETIEVAQRIKTGDSVLILSGKDRGKRGAVVRVLPRENKVVVEGVNIVTRHVKQRQGARQAGLIQQESPISLSKVMLIDPDTGRPGRTARRYLEDGSKVRVIKSGRRDQKEQ